jgi:hypothetical protein
MNNKYFFTNIKQEEKNMKMKELIIIARKLFYILKEERDLWAEMLNTFTKIQNSSDYEAVSKIDPEFTENLMNIKIMINTFVAHRDIVLDEASRVIDENDSDTDTLEIE